jgi:hypothetical protein
MNEFGEPNMGNPSVRFDEGRSGSAGLTTAVSSKPPPSTSPTLLFFYDSNWQNLTVAGRVHEPINRQQYDLRPAEFAKESGPVKPSQARQSFAKIAGAATAGRSGGVSGKNEEGMTNDK